MFDIRPYALPLSTPYRWSKGAQTERGGLIVRATIDGHEGWGETAPPPHHPVDGAALKAEAEALVDGLDLDDDFVAALDARNPPARIRTGLTTAVFAARAAAAGLSLAAYLGRGWRHPAASVPINGLVGEDTPEDAVARCESIWADGIRTFKVKCSDAHGLDDRRVAAIRAAFPEAALRLDPNEAWTPDNMLRRLDAMAPHRIEYVEEPVPTPWILGDLDRFARLKTQSPIPLALDQSVTTPGITRRILEAGAADVIVLKSQALGGFDRVAEVIRMAEFRGVVCVMTSSLETAVGLTASLHGAALLTPPLPACGLSLGRFYARDVAETPSIANGVMRVPQRPGLGLGPVSL